MRHEAIRALYNTAVTIDDDAGVPGEDYVQVTAEEYPYIADQLDDLYHNGIDGWKATIKAIKDKYPKS